EMRDILRLHSLLFIDDDGIPDFHVYGVQTCALPISVHPHVARFLPARCACPVPASSRMSRSNPALPDARSWWSSCPRVPGRRMRSEERRVGLGGGGRWVPSYDTLEEIILSVNQR